MDSLLVKKSRIIAELRRHGVPRDALLAFHDPTNRAAVANAVQALESYGASVQVLTVALVACLLRTHANLWDE